MIASSPPSLSAAGSRPGAKANAPHLISMIEKHINKRDHMIITGAQAHRPFENNDGSNGFPAEFFAHDMKVCHVSTLGRAAPYRPFIALQLRANGLVICGVVQ